ncbi:MAG: chlorophyll synthesis pathway protein BchC [Pseudomonadota bacterium]
MQADAVVFEAPGQVSRSALTLAPPGAGDIVVDTLWSGISTGTEKLFWNGRMPPFPGMGYPLVPGYETVGEVVEAGTDSGLRVGDRVFVPGANCFAEARGLFGGAAERIVVPGARVQPVDPALGAEAALLALAATAHHAVVLSADGPPELIVGHGALGRLIARAAIALGAEPPTVWEISEDRRAGALNYTVIDPQDDPRRDYARVCDVSGDPEALDTLIARLKPRGEITLAGFYPDPVRFTFPPAFMKEARLSISAEWTPSDLTAIAALVTEGRLSLDGLISHRRDASDPADAYAQAFEDPACLKMILTWRDAA